MRAKSAPHAKSTQDATTMNASEEYAELASCRTPAEVRSQEHPTRDAREHDAGVHDDHAVTIACVQVLDDRVTDAWIESRVGPA